MCMIVNLYVCIYFCLPRSANRASVRAVAAYLEQQPTWLGMGIYGKYTQTSHGEKHTECFPQTDISEQELHLVTTTVDLYTLVKYVFLTEQYYLFTPITHSSQYERRLYKYDSMRSTQCLMRLWEAAVSAGRGAGLLMPLSSSAGLIPECLLGEEVCSLTSSLGDSPAWIIFSIPPCWHCS